MTVCSVCSAKVTAEECDEHYAQNHPESDFGARGLDGSVVWPPRLSLEDADLAEFAGGGWLKMIESATGEPIEFEVAPGHSMGWGMDGTVKINGFRVRRPYRLWAWLLNRFTQEPGSVDKRRIRIRTRKAGSANA